MSDIFISYAREDKVEILKLAHALESEGWSVWWDQEIPVGKSYELVIEEVLDKAKCVLVIWSETSVKSHWVRAEAAEAQRQKKIFPLNIDGSNPPLVYRALQTADFKGWTGEVTAPVFRQLATAIHNYIGTTTSNDEANQYNSSNSSRISNSEKKGRNNVIKENNNTADTNPPSTEPLTPNKKEDIKRKGKAYITLVPVLALLIGMIIFLKPNYSTTKKAVVPINPTSERLETYKKSLLSEAAIQNFLDVNPVTDAELKDEYKKNISKSPTEYKARHILVKTEKVAKQLIKELKAGADFINLAKSKSTGPSRPQGGDLGWFTANQMVAPFSNAVIALKDNQFSTEAVQTQFGWHIILREGSRKFAPPSFESVKDKILPLLQQKKIQDFVDTLHQQANVEILPSTGDIVAKVNGKYLSKASLTQLENEIDQGANGQFFTKEKLITELVRRELLSQEAIRKKLDY